MFLAWFENDWCDADTVCKSLQSFRHNLPGVEPGPVLGVHFPGAKALASSFAMSRFAGDSAPGKTPGKRPFAKAFCILTRLLPLAKCNISSSVSHKDGHLST